MRKVFNLLQKTELVLEIKTVDSHVHKRCGLSVMYAVSSALFNISTVVLGLPFMKWSSIKFCELVK